MLLAAFSWVFPARLLPRAVAEALFSGVAGGAALMVFYRALAMGAMGLSAALAGLLTAVLPVALAIRTEGLPAPAQLWGFAAAAGAIALIAYAPGSGSRRALLWSALAGLGFGLQLIWLHSSAGSGAASAGGALTLNRAGEGTAALAPVLRALTLSRLGGATVALAAFLFLQQPSPPQSKPARLPLPVIAILAGLLDTAGNGFYMLSSLSGRLDVAAVLSSLYPGGTILLAALLLRERATRAQALGMALALVAVALIAA